jgi:hypothetical protein
MVVVNVGHEEQRKGAKKELAEGWKRWRRCEISKLDSLCLP